MLQTQNFKSVAKCQLMSSLTSMWSESLRKENSTSIFWDQEFTKNWLELVASHHQKRDSSGARAAWFKNSSICRFFVWNIYEMSLSAAEGNLANDLLEPSFILLYAFIPFANSAPTFFSCLLYCFDGLHNSVICWSPSSVVWPLLSDFLL